MKWHADDNVDIDAVPGFLSIVEVIFTVTEYFEFATRLAQAGVYSDLISIHVRLSGISGFMLAADRMRAWSSDYISSEQAIEYRTTLSVADLVGSSAEQALRCATSIFERFGWLKPNIEVIKADQQRLLSGRL
jgi:hypothetical protein